MPITGICVCNVVCGSRDTPVIDAAELMRQRHVGDVIVIDQVGGRRVRPSRKGRAMPKRSVNWPSSAFVDAAEGLVGINASGDMLHQLAAPLAVLSELAGRGRRYEAVTRA